MHSHRLEASCVGGQRLRRRSKLRSDSTPDLRYRPQLLDALRFLAHVAVIGGPRQFGDAGAGGERTVPGPAFPVGVLEPSRPHDRLAPGLTTPFDGAAI